MKNKLSCALCAAALLCALVGCALGAPQSVGSIGGVEISSGLYRLAQYEAYQQAAKLAPETQDTSNAKNFLAATVTVNGESTSVSVYVERKTLENLQIYSAVETRFKELGGALTAEEEAEAANYANQLYEQYGSVYKANGISSETLEQYERALLKERALLTLIYGPNGESPVSDEELAAYLRSEVYICYATVPLYNASSYAPASENEKAQMLALAKQAADGYNSAVPASTAKQAEKFKAEAQAALPDIYSVIGNNYAGGGDFACGLITEAMLSSSFTAEAAAALKALPCGEAAAVQYSGSALMLCVRLNPVEYAGTDALRAEALSSLKGEELNASLAAYGRQLQNELNENAMQRLPASDIKTE